MSEVEMKMMKNESSKKCLDEKFKREKKMFDFMVKMLDESECINELGVEDWEKLKRYYVKESRGEKIVKNYDGLNMMEVFKSEGLGVKEVCKKGYELVGEVYVKVGK